MVYWLKAVGAGMALAHVAGWVLLGVGAPGLVVDVAAFAVGFAVSRWFGKVEKLAKTRTQA